MKAYIANPIPHLLRIAFRRCGGQRSHFGLGNATNAGAAEIHWPSGQVEKVELPAADRIFTITEGKGITGVSCARQARS
jgi:hypothetical protein